jgi:hypothetical protein
MNKKKIGLKLNKCIKFTHAYSIRSKPIYGYSVDSKPMHAYFVEHKPIHAYLHLLRRNYKNSMFGNWKIL